jgi:hypothetical protein
MRAIENPVNLGEHGISVRQLRIVGFLHPKTPAEETTGLISKSSTF